MNLSEWQVHIVYHWETDSDRIVIFRRVGDGRVEVLKALHSDGNTLVETIDGAIVGPVGFSLPLGVLQSIAEKIKPGPSNDAIGVLNEALAIERSRIDRVLFPAS